MKILSSSRYLPQRIQEQSQVQNATAPSFKASKAQIAESLGKEISKNLGLSGNKLKQILADPQKSKEFFGILGGIISATTLSLLGLLNDDEEKEEINTAVVTKPTTKAENNNETTEIKKGEQEKIEFKVKRGAPFKEEKEYINFVQTNFDNKLVIRNRLTLLFNKFGGVNRDGSHAFNKNVVSNRDMLAQITTELKENINDEEKINATINKYQILIPASVPVKTKPATKEKNAKINVKFPEKFENIFKVRMPLGKKAYEIVSNSATEEEAQKKVTQICNLLEADYEYLREDKKKKALTNIGTCYLDNLEEILTIVKRLPEEEIETLYEKIADRELNTDALKAWILSRQSGRHPFSFSKYNDLKRLNFSDEDINFVRTMLNYSYVNNYKIIDPETKAFIIQMPTNKALNTNFKNIKKLFEILSGVKINLPAKTKDRLEKEDILKELENDYFNNGKTTYPNLVKYLYVRGHEIRNAESLRKYQFDKNFEVLINLINDPKIFDPHFFSQHSKLRFIERYVLNEDHDERIYLREVLPNKTREFIDNVKSALRQGVEARPYQAGDVTGVQLLIPTENGEITKITLDNESKIHTII